MIGLAITGAGYISKIHAQAVQNAPGVDIVAVVEGFAKTVRPFANMFELKNHYSAIEDLVSAGGIE